MLIIFCSDPFDRQQADSAYAGEVQAVRHLGLTSALVSYEDIVAGRLQAAARRVPHQEEEQAGIYRGWMLQPQEYAAMYEALLEHRVRLINTPEEYKYCHYLPESYPVIKSVTPDTVWLPLAEGAEVDFDEVMRLLARLGGGPVVLKDYVKSQKHYWLEACYIPDSADRAQIKRVVNRFIELQGAELSGGLVFRRFVSLATISTHPESGMPLSEEYRVFFLDGNPLYEVEYWEHGEYPEGGSPVADFLQVAQQVKSRFFTMDLARREDGAWLIVELGDAQMAGLPERADLLDFYRALATKTTPH